MEAALEPSRAAGALILAVRGAAFIAAVPVIGIALIICLLSAGTATSPPHPLEADPILHGTSPDTWV